MLERKPVILLSAHLNYNPVRGAIIHEWNIRMTDDYRAVYAD